MPQKNTGNGGNRNQLFQIIAKQQTELDRVTASYNEDMENLSKWAGNTEANLNVARQIIQRQAVQIERLSSGLQALTAAFEIGRAHV